MVIWERMESLWNGVESAVEGESAVLQDGDGSAVDKGLGGSRRVVETVEQAEIDDLSSSDGEDEGERESHWLGEGEGRGLVG